MIFGRLTHLAKAVVRAFPKRIVLAFSMPWIDIYAADIRYKYATPWVATEPD
jgi:hypothetical protein